MEIRDWVISIFTFAIVNSCVVAGFLKAAKRFLAKDSQGEERVKIPMKVSILFTFICGYAFTFYFQNSALPIEQIIINGLFVGAVSVLVYESALQSVIEIIPTLFRKISGGE